MPSTRTGTPRAAATASSMLANSSGRPTPSTATHAPAPTTRPRRPGRALSPRIEPKSTFTLAAPLPALEPDVVKRRLEQHAEAEHPREHDADDDVVGAAAAAEQAHRRRATAIVTTNRPSRRSTPSAERAERAGERRVAERVAAEHLAAQHDEVADQPATRPRSRCPRGTRCA